MSETGFAEVNGVKLYYEVAGEGHPLVLIHGGLVDRRLWDDQFDVFAQHYRVIRYDIRGFGNSDVPAGPYSNYEDLYGLLKFLGVEKAYVMGLSMGGGIAIDFTLAHPEMVAALIPVAAGVSGFQSSEASRQKWAEIEKATERGDIAQAVELENRMWTDGPNRRPEQVNPVVDCRCKEGGNSRYCSPSEHGEARGVQSGGADLPGKVVEVHAQSWCLDFSERPVEHPLWGRGKRFICRVPIYRARHVVAPTQAR